MSQAAGRSQMGAFWDRRARENAFYFVDSRLDYRSPDLQRFWAGGEADVEALLVATGVSLSPSQTVVEIGCGVGRLTRVLAARCAHVLAVDVSERMIEIARELNADLGNVSWLVGDGTSLAEVGDERADACVSHVVFQHLPDPAITLGYVREMGRVLRPGGWAAFQVSNDPGLHRPLAGRTQRVAALLGRAPGGQRAPEWLGSAVEVEELRRAVEDGGMALERIVGEGTQFCLVRARRKGPAGLGFTSGTGAQRRRGSP